MIILLHSVCQYIHKIYNKKMKKIVFEKITSNYYIGIMTDIVTNNITLNIDPLKCISVKNRMSHIQCPHKRYLNSEYCGIHKRSKTIIRIDQILNQNNIKKVVLKKVKIITMGDEITDQIYTMDDILKCESIDNLHLNIMKQTVDKLETYKILHLEGESKRQLYNHLYQYFQKQSYYLSHTIDIIKIQSSIRRYLVYRRKKAINNEDFYTLDNKFMIENKYYFDSIDDKGFTYCFDIRSFAKLLENINPSNPYNTKPISQKVIDKFNKKISYLKQHNIKLDIDKNEVSTEQAFTHRMIDIFHNYDMLENYTDHRWFEELSLIQLKELYKRAEDIWNFRSQLNQEQKNKIVHGGKAFDIPLHIIFKTKQTQKRKLQNIILNEFERFCTEGIDINEKKLGVMLMLTILVEVSSNAADALPHLVQYG